MPLSLIDTFYILGSHGASADPFSRSAITLEGTYNPSMPGSNRFSKDGFQPLRREDSPDMASPNHTTIDIPLTAVTTHGQSGARNGDNSYPQAGYGQQSEATSNPEHDEKGGLFHRSAAGRRKVNKDNIKGKTTGRTGPDGEEEILTRMGMIYSKILNFSIITRYFLYVLPLASLIAIPVVIGATAAPDAKLGGVKIVWIFTWVEIVWLSLWVSKTFAHYTPAIFQFLCGIVSSGTRKYALVLRKLEIPMSLAGWALASLATFGPASLRPLFND